jgi:phosphate transport system substrate-binding protein
VISRLPANMHRCAVIVAAVSMLALPARAATFTGAGGTAIYPLLSKWADAYAAKNGNMINYQAIGSGGGIEQIESKTVSFANSDMPLKPDVLNKNDLIQFPQVITVTVEEISLEG